MMHIGRMGRGAIDGVAHGLLLVGVSELLSSSWIMAWPVEACLAPPIAAGLLAAGVFALCICGERRIGRLCLWSVLFCLLTWGLALVNAIEWHVRLLPLREMSNGDGLLIALAAGVYLAVSAGARVLVWLLEEGRRAAT